MLPGNEPAAYGDKWPNGHGPYPIEDLVSHHGWAVFTRNRVTNIAADGTTVVEPYWVVEELHVCATCLSDPAFDVQLMHGAIPWTPEDHRSQHNYEQARQRAGEKT